MTKDEVNVLEKSIDEFDGTEWVDEGVRRTPKHIRFKPVIELSHDGRPSNQFDMREGLAAYLRRVAAYLEA